VSAGVGVQRYSHLGLCVGDLERSRRFYCEGLGFRELSRLEVEGEASDTLLELEDSVLEAIYLERDGLRLELLHYPSPGAEGDGAARAMNARGFTHLSFRVERVDETALALAALGGRVLEHTRVENPDFQAVAVFALDPDGARLELLQAPGDPAALPGQP